MCSITRHATHPPINFKRIMDVIMEMVFYKTDKLYKVLYISSLPQIAKFVNPDDTELSMYKSFSSITECASVLHIITSTNSKICKPR